MRTLETTPGTPAPQRKRYESPRIASVEVFDNIGLDCAHFSECHPYTCQTVGS